MNPRPQVVPDHSGLFTNIAIQGLSVLLLLSSLSLCLHSILFVSHYEPPEFISAQASNSGEA